MKFKLIESLLFEGKNLDRTWEQYKDKLMKLHKEFYHMNDTSEEDVRHWWENGLLALDPTYDQQSGQTGDYGIWITNMWVNPNCDGRNYTARKWRNIFDEFVKKKSNLDKKDINAYKSVQELEQTLANTQLTQRQKQRNLQKARNIDGADIVYYDNNWTVYSPNTYEASCALRKGASWCTGSTTDDSWYNRYSRKGKLYIIINNNNSQEKYQLFVKNGSRKVSEFRDIDNASIRFHDFIAQNDLEDCFYGQGIVLPLNTLNTDIDDKYVLLAQELEVNINDIVVDENIDNYCTVLDYDDGYDATFYVGTEEEMQELAIDYEASDLESMGVRDLLTGDIDEGLKDAVIHSMVIPQSIWKKDIKDYYEGEYSDDDIVKHASNLGLISKDKNSPERDKLPRDPYYVIDDDGNEVPNDNLNNDARNQLLDAIANNYDGQDPSDALTWYIDGEEIEYNNNYYKNSDYTTKYDAPFDRTMATLDFIIRFESFIDWHNAASIIVAREGAAYILAGYDENEIELGNGYYAYRTG